MSTDYLLGQTAGRICFSVIFGEREFDFAKLRVRATYQIGNVKNGGDLTDCLSQFSKGHVTN